MSEPLSPDYEAEIRDRIDRLDSDRILTGSTWQASSVGTKSVLPPEQSNVVEDVLETGHAVIRGSVGVFASKLYAEFTAHARDDIPALLDEIDRLRAELAATVKAKQENDERFQITAAEQRDRAEKAEARVDEVERAYTFDTAELKRERDDHRTAAERAEAKLRKFEHGCETPESHNYGCSCATELCRCGHRENRHAPDVYGTGTCGDCPGDEERSWKHPFTPKAGA